MVEPTITQDDIILPEADMIEPGTTVASGTQHREERIEAIGTFVRAHPGLAIAGSVAAGLVLGSLLPRRPGNKLAKRTIGIAELISAASVALGRRTADQAEDVGSKVRSRSELLAGHALDLGEAALRRASNLGHDASDSIGKASDTTLDGAGKFGRKTLKRFAKVEKKAVGRLDELAHVAATSIAKNSHVAAAKIGETGHIAAGKAEVLSEETVRLIGDASQAVAIGLARLLGPAGSAIESAGRQVKRSATEIRDKAGS